MREKDDEDRTTTAGSHQGDQTDGGAVPAPSPDIDDDAVADAAESIARAVEAVRWGTDEYAPVITSPAQVEKLKLSAVAPLVAAAAGLRTLTKEQARPWGEDKLGGSPNSARRKQFTRMCTPAGLVMPWYRPDALLEAWTLAERLGRKKVGMMVEASIQVRPDSPSIGDDGKPRKYENLLGQSTVIGVHPATPRSWMGAPRILLTEGLIKGLSALTGLLLSTGIDPTELSLTRAERDMSPESAGEAARDRLRDLMAGVPTADRILVLVVVGVGNWHHNPEWNAIDLRGGREVMVAFDGDVETNPAVYSQARQMFEFVETKGGEPSWLRIPDDGDAKRGIDDFLATGTIEELLRYRLEELPEAPAAEQIARDGDGRMNEARLVFEKYKTVTDEFGGAQSIWSPASDLVARVAATVQSRPATDEELETGRFDPRAHDDAEGEVEIEVSYAGPEGRVDATVRGPARLLAEPPERWHRNEAVHVPVKVLSHPDWPPTDKDWLAAVKSHRVDDRTESFVWDQMGWVPTLAGTPVFIAGTDVVGDRGLAPAAATPGITDREVPAASRFGLEPLVDEKGRMDKEAVAAEVRKVVDTLTAGALSSDGVVGIALAAALRPCAPMFPHSVVYFSGARRSGKALPLHTVIPTPVGDVVLADLTIGDTVLAGDGSPTVVRGMSEVHRSACLVVSLADGRELTTSAEHLWRARTREQAQAGHAAPSPDVLEGLETLRSGQAATVDEIAEVLGIGTDVLEEWVRAAAVPEEVLTSADGQAVTVHPVGEVLSLASQMRHATGPEHPTPFTTVTTTTLAAMLTEGSVQVEDGRGGWVEVASVRRDQDAWVRCVTVDHWSGTFQAGDGVVTHNSWTAKQIMSFWQATPAAFDRSLPGTAADTGYYIENAVSHTPIWVADDVAPTVDRLKAERTEAKIGDIIRAVHNQSSKGRMNANGSSRELMRPRALFVVTAENPQAAASEMDRVVHVVTGEAFFGDDVAKVACDEMARSSLSANHVTAAAIQMIAASVNQEGSWAEVVQSWRNARTELTEWAQDLMGGAGKAARHAEMAGDLLLGLEVLSRLCEHVGLGDDYDKLILRLRSALVAHVHTTFEDADATSPGWSVVRALRSALSAGAVHLVTGGSGAPPYLNPDDPDEQVRINQMLGWSYPSAEGQGERPGGRRVGELVQDKDSGTWYALLDPNAAFNEAQKAHPEIILHGSRAEPTWTSAWTEGLASGPWSRKRGRGGRLRHVVRARGKEYVPVPMLVLLGFTDPDEQDDQDGKD